TQVSKLFEYSHLARGLLIFIYEYSCRENTLPDTHSSAQFGDRFHSRNLHGNTAYIHPRLIDEDMRVKLHEPVQPRGIVLRHVHATMRAMDRVLRPTRVEVGKVRTGTVLAAPPAIVQEVAV